MSASSKNGEMRVCHDRLENSEKIETRGCTMTLRKVPTIRRRPTSDEVRVARLQRALRQVDAAKARRRYIPGPVNIVDLRRHLGMSQIRFAMRFGFPVATLRHWERGDRKPRGAALVLLN